MAAWDWTSSNAWAWTSGMVAVPLFGQARSDVPEGIYHVLLDGPAASSLFSVVDDAESLLADRRLLSWSWSSNLARSLIVDRSKQNLLEWRWDRPGQVKTWPIPDRVEAGRILEVLAQESAPSAETVISKMLRIFWVLRNDIERRSGTEQDVIRAFNTLLVWADALRRGIVDPRSSESLLTLRDIVPALAVRSLTELGPQSFSNDSVRSLSIGSLLEDMLARDPKTDLILDPDLFIRHAAGVVYEAAHISLSNKPLSQTEQRSFAFADYSIDETPARGVAGSDVHFTPPSLARALAQVAIQELQKIRPLPRRMNVLDPACGSGAFLVEALREVLAVTEARVSLVGIDRSEIARIVTSFCLRRSMADEFGRHITAAVMLNDSLDILKWGNPHLILMNPPFRKWEDLSELDKARVKGTISNRAGRIPDYSYAFLAKAIDSLPVGSVLATIVPAPFLDGSAARPLRKSILNDPSLSVRMIGKFRGLDYFKGATVEPAMLVIAKIPPALRGRGASVVRFMIANAGHEDEAIRGLRRDDESTSLDSEGWEIYDFPYGQLSEETWLPLSRKPAKLLSELRVNNPPISKLFVVRQGIQTGNNDVFLVTKNESERYVNDPGFATFFRPTADIIRNGVILEGEYVFYPFDAAGKPLVSSEADLVANLPVFFHERLKPNEGELSARLSLEGKPYWSLHRARETWQSKKIPKIVTKKFGRQGNFAYDETGRFVVLQGIAWFWRGKEFSGTDLPSAYLAVLNSPIFEGILAQTCPRTKGGQYNIYRQYIGNVPLPDLANSKLVDVELLGHLASLGRTIVKGEMPSGDSLDIATAKAYGVPLSQIRAALFPARVAKVASTFRELADQWRRETRFVSSMSDIVNNPKYQSIISLGVDAVPLILAELRRQIGHWFYALYVITGQDPVAIEERGDSRKMAAAWLNWGEQNGYR